ncbi:MAG: hypothetical protein NTZ93_00835 [Candidatus Beckwithbacteria bacterium]|nr:hypothetical protein [Candidatus Beckwithbacteria bacterium]
MGRSFDTAGVTGSEYIYGVTAGDVLRQWQTHTEASKEQDPIVLPLPRHTFIDGSSIGDLTQWKESGLFEEVNGRGVVLIASLKNANAALDTIGAARWLKAFGAEEIMLMATRLYGLRQDNVFSNLETGETRVETMTAFDSISQIADATGLDGRRLINRLVIGEAHSHIAFQMASVKNLPTLGLTAFQFIADKIGLAQRVKSNWRVLSPDFNRHSTSVLLAEYLGLDQVSFQKERDRETRQTRLINPEAVVKQLCREGVDTGVIFDDEFQTGHTVFLITDATREVLKNFIILASHANFSQETIENLNSSKITEMIVTDAMRPDVAIKQLQNGVKVQVLPVQESLAVVAGQLWRADWKEPLVDGWRLDPWLQSGI